MDNLLYLTRKPIIIGGPTATGKTEIACALAERLTADHVTAEIISADSRQIYRQMDVGTAKPSLAERRRTPHHLVDIRAPDQKYSAGEFALDARRAITSMQARGVVPIVVGGSGLYLQALMDGLCPIAQQATEEIRVQLFNKPYDNGLEELYNKLYEVDPQAARRIGRTDVQRIKRAIERAVLGYRHTGNWAIADGSPAIPIGACLCITRPRDRLYQRIDRRTERIIGSGLLHETAELMHLGYAPDCPGLQTLGYAEARCFLQDGIGHHELIERIRIRTRHFAKRQLTWFGRDRRYRWLNAEWLGTSGVVHRILQQLQR